MGRIFLEDMRYEAYTGFNPDKMANYFSNRGWPVTIMPVVDAKLVRVSKGAPLECGDGRFDQLENRDLVIESQTEELGLHVRGVRILGGINAIMATLTGGDEVGLQRATEILKRFGVAPGTHSADHGGCGYADLWIAGKLESAIYPYELHDAMNRGSLRLGRRLVELMNDLGGKHYRLNGNHKEEGVRINPFKWLTEVAHDGLRFRIDDWFLADLGIPDKVRFLKIAEVVEKLKPEAAKLEIIVPMAA